MNPYDGHDDEDDEFGRDMITMDPPRWQRWRPARPIAIAGVAVVALAAGAGVGWTATHSASAKGTSGTTAVAAAASSSPSARPAPVPFPAAKPTCTSTSSGTSAGTSVRTICRVFEGIPGGIPGGPARFARGPLGAGLIHGEFTVPKSGGGYQTIVVQRGTVTAVSGSSITVKSSDGYTLTYAVPSKTVVGAQAAGIGSVKKGDTVFVTATVTGTTATAVSILDQTAIKSGRASVNLPALPAPPKPAKAPPAKA